MQKYEFPLPSREYVMMTLEGEGSPSASTSCRNLLDIRKPEFDMFRRRLAAMEREGELMQNRKGAYIVPERAT